MCGQGTLTITFDGLPLPVAGSQPSVIPNYSESEMYFAGDNGFWHAGAHPWPNYPYNGTPYLQGFGHAGFGVVTGGFTDFSLFGVSSIEVAGYSTDYPDFNINFYARRHSDGSLLTANISGIGVNFRTLYFGPEWSSGLIFFRISNGPSSPDGWSLDNLVVSIPEPGTGALLVIGALAFSYWRTGKRKAI